MPRTKGAKQFNKQEVDILLKQLKVELSVGSDDWEELTEKYNSIAERKGLPMRDMERLKRKFKSGYSSKKPTGDPTMPDWVRTAKHIHYLIEAKCQVKSIDESENPSQFEIEFEEEEEEEDEIEQESEIEDSVDEESEKEEEIVVPTLKLDFTQGDEDVSRHTLRTENITADKKRNKQRYPDHIVPAAPQAVKKKARVDDAI